MKTETQEAVLFTYRRVLKMKNDCAEARNKATGQQAIMLAGKTKAYTDVLNMMLGHYKGRVEFPE